MDEPLGVREWARKVTEGLELRLREVSEREAEEDFSGPWIRSGWPAKHPAVATAWITAMVQLCGFDAEVLAAQAKVVVDEMDAGEDTYGLLYDDGNEHDPDQWTRVLDPEQTLAGLVDAIGALPLEASDQVVIAIATAPDRPRAVAFLEAQLDRTRIWARLLTARILLICAEDLDADARARAWLGDDDPLLRAASAGWWSYRAASRPAPPVEFERSLQDSDEGVREAALSSLRVTGLTTDLRDRLAVLRSEDRQGWRCRFCGIENPRSKSVSCVKCSIVGPEVARKVDELLGDRPPMGVARNRRPRRVRRR